MSRKKSTSTAAPKKGERLILDRIMNTRDPHMKETYFRLFDEEWERSGYPAADNPDQFWVHWNES